MADVAKDGMQPSIVSLQEAIAESLGVRETAGVEDPAMLHRIARARSVAPTGYAPLYAELYDRG
jgi:hypothetical protein